MDRADLEPNYGMHEDFRRLQTLLCGDHGSSTARHEAHRGDSGFAEANAGLQPAAVLKPDRDNDTSVIRGPAIRKAGWLNSNGAVKHTAACEKSYISGVIRKSTEKPYFQKALLGAVSA